MYELALGPARNIPPMDAAAIDKVRELEAVTLAAPQIEIATDHVIHAGVYARTIRLEAGTVLTGAFIKIATTLIISGDAIVYVGGEAIEVQGYRVFAAAAGRKQAFFARGETHLTMIFATKAKSVREAEDEFTDEGAQLFSRRLDYKNTITITGA